MAASVTSMGAALRSGKRPATDQARISTTTIRLPCTLISRTVGEPAKAVAPLFPRRTVSAISKARARQHDRVPSNDHDDSQAGDMQLMSSDFEVYG